MYRRFPQRDGQQISVAPADRTEAVVYLIGPIIKALGRNSPSKLPCIIHPPIPRIVGVRHHAFGRFLAGRVIAFVPQVLARPLIELGRVDPLAVDLAFNVMQFDFRRTRRLAAAGVGRPALRLARNECEVDQQFRVGQPGVVVGVALVGGGDGVCGS